MAILPEQIELYSKAISHSQVFNGIDQAALKDLIVMGSVSDFKDGDFVIEEEKRVPGLFILLEGAANVLKGTKLLTTYGRGSFFGEISLFGVAFGATASIQAREKAKFLLITKEILDQWSKKYPDAERIFLRKMCTELCRRVYSTSEKLS